MPQKPRRDRVGPEFEVAEQRWPEVGGILARQPWPEVIEVLDPADRGATLERLQRFCELTLQWNRSVSNLISQNDESRIALAHLAPCVEPAAWIRSHDLANWLDLGSGGGFPAIPLAICGVGQNWDLVESRRTKTLFLRRAAQELGLAGVKVYAARIEDLLLDLAGGAEEWAPDEADSEAVGRLRVPFDGFTSRATMSLGPTLRLARPLVRAGGAAFLWKGSRLEDEIREAGSDLDGWTESERRGLKNGQTTVIKYTRDKE